MISESIVKKFVAMVSSKRSKRQSEWNCYMLFNFIWVVIMTLVCVMFHFFSGWWIILAIVLTTLLTLGVLAAQYAVMGFLIAFLYPPSDKLDVNGDDDIDALTKLNSFIKMMEEANNE